MPSPLAEEQALVELWRQGNEDAARQIVDRYLDRLIDLARRRLSQRLAGRVDPEDVVQSAFRTFFDRLRDGKFSIDHQDDLAKLLIRITLHKTLRQVAFHTAGKRDANLELPQGEDARARLLAVLDSEPTPEATVAFLDELEHFFRQLKPVERQVIEHRLQGYGTEEIAKRLGLYDRKVRRVLEHVRSLAEKEGWGLGGPPPE
jgi:RNA polymerase sigma-70 factor (ECF subfamily)